MLVLSLLLVLVLILMRVLVLVLMLMLVGSILMQVRVWLLEPVPLLVLVSYQCSC